MLIGLVLLSLNLESLVERAVVAVCLFWEKRYIKPIVLKNLTAHRVRNRKTTIMYSLSLGFILFITVAYKTEIQAAQYNSLQKSGTRLSVRSYSPFLKKYVKDVENALANSDAVENYAWVSKDLTSKELRAKQYDRVRITTLGHIYSERVSLRGISPSYCDTAMPEFTRVYLEHPTKETMSFCEQLYTAEGSQAVAISTAFKDELYLDDLTVNSSFLLALQRESAGPNEPMVYSLERLKPIALVSSLSGLDMTSFSQKLGNNDVLVSFPTLLRLAGDTYSSINDLPLEKIVIKMKESASEKDIDVVKRSLSSLQGGKQGKLFDYRDLRTGFGRADLVMDFVFSCATYIAMGLCLFSLMASMYTNIYEQSKEIGVLRALGLTTWHIVRVYVFEAFVLTMSASIMGVIIGTIIAWTMTAQRALFTESPASFNFPTMILAAVFIGATSLAIISALLPSWRLAKKPIASIMRTYL